MIKQTLKEWKEDAVKRFREDAGNWKFKCPACGHVSSVKHFKDLGDDGNSAYQECIGRHTGKGAPTKDSKDGCNWAAYGLFGNLGKGRIIITPGGKEVEVFDFADKEE